MSRSFEMFNALICIVKRSECHGLVSSTLEPCCSCSRNASAAHRIHLCRVPKLSVACIGGSFVLSRSYILWAQCDDNHQINLLFCRPLLSPTGRSFSYLGSLPIFI